MKLPRRQFLHLAAGAAALPALAHIAKAQTYPARPVHVIVPFAAGGPSDYAARTIGEALAKQLGQSIVIDNRPGADGVIAVEAVLSAPPDGYTLLFGGSSQLPLPLLKKPAPFDSAHFAPIARVTQIEWVMYVSPTLPTKSIAELVVYARNNPGKLSYAASNLSEHLAAVLFIKATGTEMVRVPYKGFAQALPDLMTGRVHVNVAPLSAVLPHARDGKVRMLAVLMPERSRFAPEVPSIADVGLTGLSIPGWQAFLASAKTPSGIITRLDDEINKALHDPEVRARFEQQSVRAEGSTAQGLAAIIKRDLQIWSDFIRENGALLEQ
jgi:tripartite-type tricarboxylate transporter receptor subunit TctC